MIFNLNKDNTEIIVEKVSSSTDYDDFLADLPENECRWAVYDFEFEKPDGGKRNKLVLLSWFASAFLHLCLGRGSDELRSISSIHRCVHHPLHLSALLVLLVIPKFG